MSNGVDFRKLALDLRAQLTTAQSELTRKDEAYQGAHMMCQDLKSELAALREELSTLRDQHAEQSCVFCNNSGELLTKVKTLEEERSRTTETLIQYEQGFWGRIASKNRKEADDLQQRLTAAEQRNEFFEAQVAAKDVGIDFRDALINAVRMSSKELLMAWVPHDWEAKRQTLLSNAKPTESGASE